MLEHYCDFFLFMVQHLYITIESILIMLVNPSNNLLYTVYDGGRRYVICMKEESVVAEDFNWMNFHARIPTIIKKFNMDPYQ